MRDPEISTGETAKILPRVGIAITLVIGITKCGARTVTTTANMVVPP